MEIRFKNTRVKKELEIANIQKNISNEIAKHFQKVLNQIDQVEDLKELQLVFRGLNVERLINKGSLWSLRLNKKYRLEFITEDVEMNKITEITLVRIHGHKYG